MSEEDWGSIPLNPYKLMSKYMRLWKSAYAKDKMLHITGDFIEEQGLTGEYADFLEAWHKNWRDSILRGDEIIVTHKGRET